MRNLVQVDDNRYVNLNTVSNFQKVIAKDGSEAWRLYIGSDRGYFYSASEAVNSRGFQAVALWVQTNLIH